MFLLSANSNARLTDTNYELKCDLPRTEMREVLCPCGKSRVKEYDSEQMRLFYKWNLQTSTEYLYMLNESREDTMRCEIARAKIQHPWTCLFTSHELNSYFLFDYYFIYSNNYE